jgi:hypothetical protein
LPRNVAIRVGGDLPHPKRSACCPQPQIESPVGKRRARISRKHKLRGREVNPARSQDAAAFKALLDALPLKERRTQASGNGHILKDAPLALDPESDNFLPHPLAIAPGKLDQLLEPAGGLEESVGQVEREGGAVALPPDFEIVEQPADVGEEKVADLRLLVERRLDFRKRVFQVPVLVGKGKRGPDLFEARRVLAVSQEPIGLQGSRKRKTARIETRGPCPGQKPCPDALVRCETVSRKIPTPRGLEEIGRKPLNVTPLEPTFLIFPKHGGILHSWSSFAITALIVPKSRTTEKICNIIVFCGVSLFHSSESGPFRGSEDAFHASICPMRAAA